MRRPLIIPTPEVLCWLLLAGTRRVEGSLVVYISILFCGRKERMELIVDMKPSLYQQEDIVFGDTRRSDQGPLILSMVTANIVMLRKSAFVTFV
jgi:hypothetical protein